LRQRSLRLRLLAAAAICLVAGIVATGTAIFFSFRASVERETRLNLEANLSRLVALIDPGVDATALRAQLPDPRFALPYSGLYWQVLRPDGTIVGRSRSLWDQILNVPPDADPKALVTVAGPDRQSLAALAWRVDLGNAEGAGTYLVTVAEDRGILDETIRDFGTDMAIAQAMLAIAIFIAASLAIEFSLSPLDRVRRKVEAVRRGAADRLDGQYLSELMPLVGEVNELLALRDKSVQFARTRAADLAHGLKTPLQVLTAITRKLRAAGDEASADALDAIVSEMSDKIDYHLRLARLRLRMRSDMISTSLHSAVLRTVTVMRQTQDGQSLDWQVELGPDVPVNIDGHDLLELVGVLVENAAKWAKSRVQVTGRAGPDLVELTVADDGPGLAEEETTRLGVRGRRLDESRQGSGLGLAIAMEILELNDGRAEFGRSELGGLAVTISLPAAGEPAAARTPSPS
jgi:signal transduction histidine kinase